MSINQRKKKTAKKTKKKDAVKAAASKYSGDIVPPGHLFYEEIGGAIVDASIALEFARLSGQKVSKERFLRAHFHDLIEKSDLTKIASNVFARIIEQGRRSPLNSVCSHAFDLMLDEYNLIKAHLKTFEDVSYIERFRNAIQKFEEDPKWQCTPIVVGDNTIYEDNVSRFYYPKEFHKNYHENTGLLFESFYVAFRTQVDLQDGITKFLDSGLLCHHTGMNKGYHSIIMCPNNNVVGIPILTDEFKSRFED